MKTTTILLILEDATDLQVYGTALRALGYKVLMCSSHTAGIDSMETKDVDLVIVSQGTRAFEGGGVLGCVLQLQPNIPVLVVARVLDIHCYLEAMELGAADYLERPEVGDLLWTVETQMRREAIA